MEKLTQARLDELRTTVPHLELEDIAEGKPGMPKEEEEDLRAYFRRFAKPSGEHHDCLRCGNALTGLATALLGGGFQWGLVHGHGHCAKCHWPATAHHFIKDRHGRELITASNLILQTHPDDIEL